MKTTCPSNLPGTQIISSDLQATQRFYAAFLHETQMLPGPCLVCKVGGETLCFGLPKPDGRDVRREKRDGVARIVFGVESERHLREVAQRLNEKNVPHSGIYADLAAASKLHLHDPDGTRVEFIAGLASPVIVHFA